MPGREPTASTARRVRWRRRPLALRRR